MPRRPSAELRSKLFSSTTPIARSTRSIPWNWLSPVTVCAFTMLVVLGGRPHSGGHFGTPDTNLFFASMTMSGLPRLESDPSPEFALTKHDLNLEQNVWREAIFDSTNLSQTHSSKRPLPLGRTNSLTL
ncbi:MAG: hypothetical protein ABIQ35_05780 [Verrucomicrobiota bacterium]